MSFMFAAVVLFICYVILDLVYFRIYFGILLARDRLKSKAYWRQYLLNDLAMDWFINQSTASLPS